MCKGNDKSDMYILGSTAIIYICRVACVFGMRQIGQDHMISYSRENTVIDSDKK